MKIVNCKFKIVPGFTIIELLIVIFIFSTVMIMASSSFATSYISGRTHSSSSMEANRSLSSVLDIIGQKMANASGSFNIYGTERYGFYIYNNSLLTIILKDDQCAYFGRGSGTDSNNLNMLQIGCLASPPAILAGGSGGWEKISSSDIKITNFSFPVAQRNEFSPANETAPYLTVFIIGTDTKTGGKATLQSTYSIPAYTYNKW